MSGISVRCLEVFSCLSARRAHWFPSSSGMFVYMLVTSMVQRRMFSSSFLFSIVLMKCVVSLMYVGRRTTACFIQWSRSLDMFEVMLLTHEHIGL